MQNDYRNEEWRDVNYDDNISENEIHKVSNYGRIRSFKVNKTEGVLLKPATVQGYPRIKLKQKNSKSTARYVHKLVAESFLSKTNELQEFVIHLDYNKKNNHVRNLKWVTFEEKAQHQLKNPSYNLILEKRRLSNSKLNEVDVRRIKRQINNPNRKTRMKMIAKQFGISEMQLYRIKSGENWGHVTDR